MRCIHDTAFHGCSKLAKITVAHENKHYISEDNILYNKDKTKLVLCAAAKTGGLTIPESVVSLGTAAFDCSLLKEIAISKNITEVSSTAFSSCKSLIKIKQK